MLASTQSFALERGHYVSRMMPRMHGYHLDDAPELKSCNLEIAALPGEARKVESRALPTLTASRIFMVGQIYPESVTLAIRN